MSREPPSGQDAGQGWNVAHGQITLTTLVSVFDREKAKDLAVRVWGLLLLAAIGFCAYSAEPGAERDCAGFLIEYCEPQEPPIPPEDLYNAGWRP